MKRIWIHRASSFKEAQEFDWRYYLTMTPAGRLATTQYFVELLRLFNKHGVRYSIVGSFAVAVYAMPRYTKDLDILVEPTVTNGERICRALRDFGFGSLNIKPKDFAQKDRFIQLGYEPLRIDLLTSIDGVTFDRVWRHKKVERFGSEKTYFIGLGELIKNKKASGRKQDLVDLEILRKIERKKKA